MSEGQDPEVLRAKINAETAQIAWTGVQRFFAQGMATRLECIGQPFTGPSLLQEFCQVAATLDEESA